MCHLQSHVRPGKQHNAVTTPNFLMGQDRLYLNMMQSDLLRSLLLSQARETFPKITDKVSLSPSSTGLAKDAICKATCLSLASALPSCSGDQVVLLRLRPFFISDLTELRRRLIGLRSVRQSPDVATNLLVFGSIRLIVNRYRQ